MANRRAARIAERIRQDVSLLVLKGLRDPRLELLTITRVEVSDDLAHARVYFSVLGGEGKRSAAEHALRSARGLIRSHVAKGLGLREAPDIAFQFDPSVEKAIEITRLLDQVASELHGKQPAPPASDDEAS